MQDMSDIEKENRRVWTLAAIRQDNERHGNGLFFSRNNMRFAGDKMTDFRVEYEGENIFVVRVSGRGRIGARWRYQPYDGTNQSRFLPVSI